MKSAIAEKSPAADHERAEKKSGGGKADAETQELQKKMKAASTPGPAHKALEAFAGHWKTEAKCWMDPDGEPSVSHGTAKTVWTLNGHFLEEEFRGEMMGKPFTGRSLMGYDNIKETFNTVWVSDMQTSILTSEGKGEDGNKTITLEGTTSCPMTGKKDISIKTVFRVLGPDKHVFEMFNDGVRTMELTYTRS